MICSHLRRNISCNSQYYFRTLYKTLKCTSNIYVLNKRFTHSWLQDKNQTKLFEEIFKVNPGFGQLNISGAINYIIKATCPETYPNADHTIIKCYGPSTHTSSTSNIINTKLNEKQNVIDIRSNDKFSNDFCCEIHLPLKYDVNALLTNLGSIHLEQLESEKVSVKTIHGHLSTKKLKAFNFTVDTIDGKIHIDGVLQGNLFVNAMDTEIHAKRLQGLRMNIKSEKLKMFIKSSYIEDGYIKTSQGNLNLGSLHGFTNIDMSDGNLNISSFHGKIEADLVNVNTTIQISQITDNSYVNTKSGRLEVSVPHSYRYNLETKADNIDAVEDLKGKEIECSDGQKSFVLQSHKDFPTIKFQLNNGNASVKLQDWFSTLGINLKKRD